MVGVLDFKLSSPDSSTSYEGLSMQAITRSTCYGLDMAGYMYV